MNELAFAICGVLAVFVIFQILCTSAFLSSLRLPNLRTEQHEWLPKAVVILCLRGSDPFLADCIRALLYQNYPQYNLHIIIDSQQDPAWNIVKETIQQAGATHVQVSPLLTRPYTCSLKCSALVQAILALDNSYEVVAFIDADVIAHPNWLRELVTPLVDEQIGVSTGNRWYMPYPQQWGSLVRYVYNSVSVVSMYIHKYSWGGSMAMKLSVLQQSQLLETWTQTISVDGPVYTALQKIGLKVKFVPTVMMLNREECNLTQCLRFIKRQLLMPRLYHPKWKLFVVQIFAPALTLLIAIELLLIALVNHNFTASAWVGSGLIGYILIIVLLLTLLEQGVQRVVCGHDKPIKSFSFQVIAKTLLAILFTQLIFVPFATVLAMLMPNVEWRGITYQIKSAKNIRLIEYHSYQHSSQSLNTNTSL
ncbi:glycosyltransferase family 2 protein [Nostoc sp. PA-18-2419]|uniref:glycosyltransferase family 2 protein n=1 Tax=Nostoc sp. PA-18-2419 TaxID=2575443 RepID=UPI001109E992|nr:glycosyltransferase family 2 protein [Nostoc sp. PA-18-2419]